MWAEKKDTLGMILHKSARPSKQYADTSKKANSTLGMIRRNGTKVTRDKASVLRLYKTLQR